MKALSADLKDPALEGTNDEGESLLYHALVQHLYDLHISKEQLYEYDQNIIRHTKKSMCVVPKNTMEVLSVPFTAFYGGVP